MRLDWPSLTSDPIVEPGPIEKNLRSPAKDATIVANVHVAADVDVVVEKLTNNPFPSNQTTSLQDLAFQI